MRCLRGQILVVPGYGAVNLYKIQKNGAIETTEIAARLAGGKQRAINPVPECAWPTTFKEVTERKSIS